jgi:hypothetical protein
MADSRLPGPVGRDGALVAIDEGTLIRRRSPAPRSLEHVDAGHGGAAHVRTPLHEVRHGPDAYLTKFHFAGSSYRLTTAADQSKRTAGEKTVPVPDAEELLRKVATTKGSDALRALADPQLFEMLHEGLVVLLRRRPPPRIARPTEPEAAPPPRRAPVVDGWIEIEITDEEGNVRGGDAYKLELPDGRVLSGRISSSGLISLHGIDPGVAKFTLTSLDTKRWS